jgi:hypothetical protein
MDKIRNIDPTQNRSQILAAITSPRVRQPAGILKKNMTDNSVYDVEDFSFDDTQELCESRSRLFDPSVETRRSSRSKRSRSGNHRQPEEAAHQDDPVLEDIASPRKDANFVARKKARRSRSVVAFEVPRADDEDTDIELGRQQRAFSLTEKTESQQRRRESRGGKGAGQPSPALKTNAALGGGEPLHSYAQKTVIKPEKCYACQKRIKFGKICLKCAGCRMTVHSECADKAPPLCAQSQSPEVCVTPRVETGGGLSRSPSKKAYFASPMLR